MVSVQIYASTAFTPGERPRVSLEQEAGWALEPRLKILTRRGKSIDLAWNSNNDLSVAQSVASQHNMPSCLLVFRYGREIYCLTATVAHSYKTADKFT